MKTLTCLLLCVGSITLVYSQKKPTEMLTELEHLTDQFDKVFDRNSFTDKLIIIFVSGADDPFTKVYDKWKGKSFRENANVQVVGGFKEMLSGSGHAAPSGGIKKHIQDAFITRYGEKHFPILIDLNSVIGESAGVKGLSIILISRRKNKIENIQDFGTDRKKFFDAINSYFNN